MPRIAFFEDNGNYQAGIPLKKNVNLEKVIKGIMKLTDRKGWSDWKKKKDKKKSIEKYDIWMEGYLCSGMEGIPTKASYEGTFKAKSFREACKMRFKNDRLFDSKNLTYWGCGLYDNEVEARASFG